MTQGWGMRTTGALLGVLLSTLLAACGGDDITIGATPTTSATATRTQTHTPTGVAAVATLTPTPTTRPTAVNAAVAGIILVGRDVSGSTDDGLMPVPAEGRPQGSEGFDRGLGNADWIVDNGVAEGTTNDEGRFSITGLTPGAHVITVTKTVGGNLMTLSLPIIVGDDGSAEVVAEVMWGLVRTTSDYQQGGAAMRAVFSPNGSRLITREGRAVELGDYSGRTLIDSDGDGLFDPQSGACDDIYRCEPGGGCGEGDRICVCVPSCPDCQDCPAMACVPRTYFHDPMCGPDGLCKSLPYDCSDNQACDDATEECRCIPSCPTCEDCAAAACVAPCEPGEPIDIERVVVSGTARLLIGQQAHLQASAILSDGSSMDVTWLASWASSQPAAASVDAWGRLTAVAIGATNVTATLADVVSEALAVEVVERPTLKQIYLQNVSCHYPGPMLPDDQLPPAAPPAADQIAPPPQCSQVVRIGGTVQFLALGEFDTGYWEDISDEVDWQVEPSEVADVVDGLFTARSAGTVSVRAAMAGVTSDTAEIRVVTQPTIVALSVYPLNWGYQYIDGGPVRADGQACFECGYAITLLTGDTVGFAATAHYDTGEWEDVSSRVTWQSSATAVASLNSGGVLTALGAGDANVDATLGDVTSGAVSVRVVSEATLQSLYAYLEGQDLAIGKGDQAILKAVGHYDVGFDRDVTAQVTWHSSDETVGGFDSPGVFTGRAAGNVTLWAELDGQQSVPIAIEVYATSELDFCDPANVNRGTWSDDFNRVTLESDCANYSQPDVVQLRFSVTETQRPGGVFNPCLDLYAYSGEEVVRTIREEGCGDPFLGPAAPGRDEAELKYQLTAFWDLKDSNGDPVPPGDYTVRGIFYLYYDPVVEIAVRVDEPAPAP